MPRTRGTGMPTALKVVAGTRTARINHDEPQPEPGIPQCPSSDPQVREVWDYTVAQLRTMRTITMADRDMLHVYCEQVVAYRAALDAMRRDGLAVKVGNGARGRHPASMIAKEAAVLIRSYGAQFGLSPAARTAIKVGDQAPKRDQGAARLLSG